MAALLRNIGMFIHAISTMNRGCEQIAHTFPYSNLGEGKEKEGSGTTHSSPPHTVVFCFNSETSVPTSTPDRTVTSSLLRGAAGFLGVAAGVSFFVGGRALHEFGKIDRTVGEMVGLVLAAALGLIAILLRGFAERLEDHDDGQPVTLAIGTAKDNDNPE